MNKKTVSISLPKIEGVELKNATVDLEKGVVIAEYGEEDLYITVKKGDFLTCISDPSKVVIFGAKARFFGEWCSTFTILYDLPMRFNGEMAYTIRGVKFPFNNFRHSTEEEKALMIEEMEKLGKRYNPKTFRIEDIEVDISEIAVDYLLEDTHLPFLRTTKKYMDKLEVRKDYIDVYDSNVIIIDRIGGFKNRGFSGNNFSCDLFCSNPNEWREATELEVIEAFEKHLVHRYGEDWRTMEIREMHSYQSGGLNNGSWEIEIVKESTDWAVWNKNGLLYCEGVWVDRLGESKIHIKEAIKERTVIHCETEEEAKRILGMASEFGYRWVNGESYIDDTKWLFKKSKTCYYLFNGNFTDYDYFKIRHYNIIPSTQIADLKPAKLSGWSLSPEDIKEIKAGEKADNRYALKRDVLTILSVESKLNPDKKLSEYLEQFKLILEVL